jgi:hypothetical protein
MCPRMSECNYKPSGSPPHARARLCIRPRLEPPPSTAPARRFARRNVSVQDNGVPPGDERVRRTSDYRRVLRLRTNLPQSARTSGSTSHWRMTFPRHRVYIRVRWVGAWAVVVGGVVAAGCATPPPQRRSLPTGCCSLADGAEGTATVRGPQLVRGRVHQTRRPAAFTLATRL